VPEHKSFVFFSFLSEVDRDLASHPLINLVARRGDVADVLLDLHKVFSGGWVFGFGLMSIHLFCSVSVWSLIVNLFFSGLDSGTLAVGSPNGWLG
jgi:hypothetical protein